MNASDQLEVQQVTRKQASSSVLKTLNVIDALVSAPAALSLKQIAHRLNLPLPTVHRLLRTLSLRNYVESVDGRYQLTLKLFQLGQAVVSKIDVIAEARPICEALSRDVGETVQMAVRAELSAVYVQRFQVPRSIRIINMIGMQVPLYCTSLGKAILAHLDPRELSRVLDKMDLAPRVRNTITNRRALERDLEITARRGWSVDNEEFDYGIVCLGAPVVDRTGKVVAAISVTGPPDRLQRRLWHTIGKRVREAADSISERLGYGLDQLPVASGGESLGRETRRHLARRAEAR